MKVSFEFSTTELAEVAERGLRQSRVVRGWRVQRNIFLAILLGLGIYALGYGSQLQRALIGLLGAAALAVYLHLRGRPQFNPRLVRYYSEQLGGDGPFTCEVELAPAGLITRQLGVESTHAWSHVKSVAEVNGDVEVVYRPVGRTLVRQRAFASPQQREEFIAQAKALLKLAQS
jgi:hypothetical protein